jgi:hypothetical protein
VPQLHFYVSQEIAEELRRKAASVGLPLSKYLAQRAQDEGDGGRDPLGWPKGYFDYFRLNPIAGDFTLPEDPAPAAGDDDPWSRA